MARRRQPETWKDRVLSSERFWSETYENQYGALYQSDPTFRAKPHWERMGELDRIRREGRQLPPPPSVLERGAEALRGLGEQAFPGPSLLEPEGRARMAADLARGGELARAAAPEPGGFQPGMAPPDLAGLARRGAESLAALEPAGEPYTPAREDLRGLATPQPPGRFDYRRTTFQRGTLPESAEEIRRLQGLAAAQIGPPTRVEAAALEAEAIDPYGPFGEREVPAIEPRPAPTAFGGPEAWQARVGPNPLAGPVMERVRAARDAGLAGFVMGGAFGAPVGLAPVTAPLGGVASAAMGAAFPEGVRRARAHIDGLVGSVLEWVNLVAGSEGIDRAAEGLMSDARMIEQRLTPGDAQEFRTKLANALAGAPIDLIPVMVAMSPWARLGIHGIPGMLAGFGSLGQAGLPPGTPLEERSAQAKNDVITSLLFGAAGGMGRITGGLAVGVPTYVQQRLQDVPSEEAAVSGAVMGLLRAGGGGDPTRIAARGPSVLDRMAARKIEREYEAAVDQQLALDRMAPERGVPMAEADRAPVSIDLLPPPPWELPPGAPPAAPTPPGPPGPPPVRPPAGPPPAPPAGPPAPPREPTQPPLPAPAPPRQLPEGFPELPSGQAGRATRIVTPERELPARYRAIELEELEASHTPVSLVPNPRYPQPWQVRPYELERGKPDSALGLIERAADRFDPDLWLSDNPSPETGPPIVGRGPDGRYYVMGGNKRTMIAQRIAAGNARTPPEVLREAMAERAGRFGIARETIEGMRNPVIVRELEAPVRDITEGSTLSALLNEVMTAPVDPAARALAASRQISPDTWTMLERMLEGRGRGPEVTARQLLRGDRGIVNALISDGVIPQNRRRELVDPQGGLSPRGLEYMEQVLLGSLVQDRALVQKIPSSYADMLVRSTPALLDIQRSAPQVPLAELVTEAVRSEVARFDANQGRTGRDRIEPWEWMNQASFDQPTPLALRNPAAAAIATALAETRRPTEFAARWADMARSLRGDMLEPAREDPSAAFQRIFGAELPALEPTAEPGRPPARPEPRPTPEPERRPEPTEREVTWDWEREATKLDDAPLFGSGVMPEQGIPTSQLWKAGAGARETLRTGQPARLEVFRGFLREERGKIYDERAAEPILGPDLTYWAITEESARNYGPVVEAAELHTRNPLVLMSDLQLEAFMGRTIPMQLEKMRPFGETLRRKAEEAGHDALVVMFPRSDQADVSPQGEPVTRMRALFGESQVVGLAKERYGQTWNAEIVRGEEIVDQQSKRELETRRREAEQAEPAELPTYRDLPDLATLAPEHQSRVIGTFAFDSRKPQSEDAFKGTTLASPYKQARNKAQGPPQPGQYIAREGYRSMRLGREDLVGIDMERLAFSMPAPQAEKVFKQLNAAYRYNEERVIPKSAATVEKFDRLLGYGRLRAEEVAKDRTTLFYDSEGGTFVVSKVKDKRGKPRYGGTFSFIGEGARREYERMRGAEVPAEAEVPELRGRGPRAEPERIEPGPSSEGPSIGPEARGRFVDLELTENATLELAHFASMQLPRIEGALRETHDAPLVRALRTGIEAAREGIREGEVISLNDTMAAGELKPVMDLMRRLSRWHDYQEGRRNRPGFPKAVGERYDRYLRMFPMTLEFAGMADAEQYRLTTPAGDLLLRKRPPTPKKKARRPILDEGYRRATKEEVAYEPDSLSTSYHQFFELQSEGGVKIGPTPPGGRQEMRQPRARRFGTEARTEPARMSEPELRLEAERTRAEPGAIDPLDQAIGESVERAEMRQNPPVGSEGIPSELLPTPQNAYYNKHGKPEGEPGRRYEAMSVAQRYGHRLPTRGDTQPGDLWVGHREVPVSQEVPATTIQRRFHIMRPLLKHYGQNVIETVMRGAPRDLQGYTRAGVEIEGARRGGFGVYGGDRVMRLRNWGDFESLSHEVGHLLHHLRPDLLDPWIMRNAEQLKRVSYDRENAVEGGMEMIRYWATNKGFAQERLPNAYRELEELIRSLPKKESQAWLDFQELSHRFFAAGRTHWMRAFLKADEASFAGLHRDFKSMTDFRQAWLDDRWGLAAAELYLYGHIVPGGAWEHAKALRHVRDWTHQLIERGVPRVERIEDVKGRKTSYGQERGIYRLGVDTELGGYFTHFRPFERDGRLEDFQRYLTALRADELERPVKGAAGYRRNGVNSGIPREVIDHNLLLEKANPDFRPAAMNIIKLNHKMIEFLVDLGAISEKQGEKILAMNQFYTFKFARQGPFAEGPIPAVWHLTSTSALPKQIRGSSRGLRPILESVIDGPLSLMQFGLENHMRQTAVREILQMPKGGRFLERIPPSSQRVRKHVHDVLQAANEKLKELGLPELPSEYLEAAKETVGDPAAMLSMFIHGNRPSGKVLTVMEQGRPSYYEVLDPYLWRSFLASQRRPMMYKTLRAADKLRRIKQASIVYTPNFAVPNLFRDVVWAKIMSEVGFGLTDISRGVRDAMLQNATHWDRRANLGGFSGHRETEYALEARLRGGFTKLGVEITTPGEFASTIGRLVREGGKLGLRGIRGYERVIESFEHAPRDAIYSRAIDVGETPFRAGFLAGDITADWATRGDSNMAELAYRTIPFFHAASVGFENMTRRAFVDPRTRGYRWKGRGAIENRDSVALRMAIAAMTSGALYAWNSQFEHFQDQPLWNLIGYSHFIIPDPSHPQGFHHFKVAKTWDVGLLQNITEALVHEMLVGMGESTDREAWKWVLQSLMTNFGLEMPHPIGVGAEQLANREHPLTSLLTQALGVGGVGRRIVRRGQEELPASLQYTEHTSPFLRRLALSIHNQTGGKVDVLSPARAEHLIEGLFGTMGAMALGLMDSVVTPEGEKRERRWYEWMVARRFAEPKGRFSRYREEWYDLFSSIDQTARTMSKLENEIRRGAGGPAVQEALRSAHERHLRSPEHLHRHIRKLEKLIDAKRDQLDTLMRSPRLTPRQKTDNRERILREIDALMKQGVTSHEEFKRRLEAARQ